MDLPALWTIPCWHSNGLIYMDSMLAYCHSVGPPQPVMWVSRCWYGTEIGYGIVRDQPISRFHGRDIFREIGLLLWKTSISVKPVKFCEICDFSWILTLLLSFMKVIRVLSTAFVQILLFATCHTSALSSWHVFTVLLTSSLESWLSTLITIINIRCSEISNVLFDRFLSLH